jgi:hypothetical protein
MTAKPRRTSRQHQAVVALSAGATIADAARQAGCSTRTVSRWLDDADFVAKIERERQAVIGQASAKLGAASQRAVEVLAELLDDPLLPTVRLSAAKAVLDGLLRLRQEFVIESRLAAIEARLAKPATSCGDEGGDR